MPFCHTLRNMRSKMNLVFLCAFGLFAIVHGQEPSAEQLEQYLPCFEYGLCKDPSMKKELLTCLNPLSKEEFQSLFQNFKSNYFSFKSDTLSGAISEFCGASESTEESVADDVVDADFSFQKEDSDEGDKSEETKLEKATKCAYKMAKKVQSDGKC